MGVTGSDEVERTRLMSALAHGPERRMAQDRELGRGPSRADLDQAASYRRRIAAIERGAVAPVVVDAAPADVLALDRIERAG